MKRIAQNVRQYCVCQKTVQSSCAWIVHVGWEVVNSLTSVSQQSVLESGVKVTKIQVVWTLQGIGRL